MNIFKPVSLLLLLLPLICVGCAPKSQTKPADLKAAQTMGGEIKSVDNILDPFVEKALGQKLFAHVLSQYTLYENTKLSRYINQVGAHVSIPGRRNVSHTFYILDTPEIFSMGLPAGHVLVSRGLLKQLENESELAGVLGVEIANIEQQFFIADIQRKGEIEKPSKEILSRQFNELKDDRFTDTQISTADRLGMIYAQHFGYDPARFNAFLTRLNNILKSQPAQVVGTGKYSPNILDHRESIGQVYVKDLQKHQTHFPKVKDQFADHQSLF